MRSTGFVMASIMVHGLAVAAVVLSPQQLHELVVAGAPIEVTMNEPAAQPGVPDAPAPVTEAPKVAASPTPEPAVIPESKPEPVAVKAKPVAKPVVAKPKLATKLPAKQAPPEKLDSQVEDKAPEFTQHEEEAPKLVPVKESVAGVEADTSSDKSEDAAADQAAEETKAEPVVAITPAPAPKAAPNVQAAAPVAAVATVSTQEGSADLGKGGATQAGAVEFTSLKQMNGNRAPLYPLAARRDKRQGQVELLYRVTSAGAVSEVTVAQSSGSQDLDNEAVRAISRFKFVPGQEGWARHPVNFALKGDTAALPSRLRTKSAAQE